MEVPERRNPNTSQLWERIWRMSGEHKGTLPIYQLALSLMPHGARFLDLGCGTGLGMRYLLSNGLKGVGMDYAPYCAEYESQDHPGKPEIIIQDIQEHFPFKGEEFLLVLCIMAFYCLERPVEMLREARRVLKLGGNLLIANPYTHAWKEEFYFTPTMRELHELIKPVFPECVVFKYKAWKVALATKVEK